MEDARPDDERPNHQMPESYDDSDKEPRGATPRWINLADKPKLPDWLLIIMEREDPSTYIWQKLSAEAFAEAMAYELVFAPDPGELELGYHFMKAQHEMLWPGMPHDKLDEVHAAMWNWFTGGRG